MYKYPKVAHDSRKKIWQDLYTLTTTEDRKESNHARPAFTIARIARHDHRIRPHHSRARCAYTITSTQAQKLFTVCEGRIRSKQEVPSSTAHPQSSLANKFTAPSEGAAARVNRPDSTGTLDHDTTGLNSCVHLAQSPVGRCS